MWQSFNKLNWREKAFIVSTIALICFGAMGYFLGKLCGSYMDEWQMRPITTIMSSLWFDKYLLWLALSIAVGLLLYRGMGCLCNLTNKHRWIHKTLAVILVIWNIFMTIACIASCVNREDPAPVYDGGDIAWYVSRSEEIQYMRSKSVWFGPGDHYYTYPEFLQRENLTGADETVREVMDRETTRAYHTFVRWRSETLLPVLTYCFGKWVGLLFSLLVPFWFIGALAGSTAVKGNGKKALYGSCLSLVGIQLLLTLLDYYGIACWDMPVVFSTADWTAMIPVATIQLTAMWFLIKENRITNEHNDSHSEGIICEAT